MRILVVDDDRGFREELTDLLGKAKHIATGVPSAARALEALSEDEYDVMFTDLRMGRHSGMDLLVRARERWPRLLVVMLTGKATVETAIQALQLGAFDYLRKPIRSDQVQRVLELVDQQLALTRAGAKPLDPGRYASALAAEGGYEVLLISPPPVHVTTSRVSILALDPENPFRIRDAVEDFVTPKERAAVVLAAVEQLLEHHREEDIATLLGEIRAILVGKGPLAVRSSIVSADANTTLESLASPIRRLVLHRLSDGTCSFTQAMEAAHLTDTSKIAFHLRKLEESGLITHEARERYRLTVRGRGAISILSSIDHLDSRKGSGNRVFPSKIRPRTTS